MAPPPDLTPARSLLSGTKLSELLKPGHVITIKQTATVDQALRVLATHRILSAPVVGPAPSDAAQRADSAEPQGHIQDVSGFIDVRDILSSFLQELDLPSLAGAKMLKRMRVLEEQGQRFAGKSLSELKSLGSDGAFYNRRQAAQASLRQIVHDGFLNPKHTNALFGGTRSRPVVHRLALFDTAGELTHVVSQSDVVAYLHSRAEALGEMAAASVGDLGFVCGAAGVVSVTPDTPALDAMVLMEERGISAVAVVGGGGGIVGNFSISELRTIVAEHFGSLALPVGEFLALEHGTEYAGYVAQREAPPPPPEAAPPPPPLGASPPPSAAGFQFAAERELRRRDSGAPGAEVGQALVTCGPGTRFGEALALLVRHRLHRVYVCDDSTAPVGVITLTDVLRKLVEA